MKLLGVAALATVATVGLASATASADALSPAESVRLRQGEQVTRLQQIDRGARHYVGGVSYALLDASPLQLAAVEDDVASWRHFLPSTRDSRRIGEVAGDPLIQITQGTALIQVSYAVRVHREGNELRFWMDRTRAHDIDDAWGFLRADPQADGRTLVTWGILFDMGPGLLRDLFESRAQVMALGVPERVRDVVVARAARGRRASR